MLLIILVNFKTTGPARRRLARGCLGHVPNPLPNSKRAPGSMPSIFSDHAETGAIRRADIDNLPAPMFVRVRKAGKVGIMGEEVPGVSPESDQTSAASGHTLPLPIRRFGKCRASSPAQFPLISGVFWAHTQCQMLLELGLPHPMLYAAQ